MTGTDESDQDNTSPGHNSNAVALKIHSTSNNGGYSVGDSGIHWGGSTYHSPGSSDIASQWNSNGGDQISASDVSNIRGDGEGGYAADISGHYHTVSDSEGGWERSNDPTRE